MTTLVAGGGALGVQPQFLAHAAPLPSAIALGLATHYFSDLNAHRYTAAAAMEATCIVSIVQTIPGTNIRSSFGFGGRPGERAAEAHGISFVKSARISRIRTFSTPVLRRYHLIGVWVYGVYRFVYPTKNWVANNERPSGYHHITIIVMRCGKRWEIDPGWTGSGGDYSWK